MQQATNRVCRQHRFWLFQQILVGVSHAAVVPNRIHRIDDLGESTEDLLWLRARRVNLKLRMLLADQIKQSGDIGTLFRSDAGLAADRDEISMKSGMDTVDPAHRAMCVRQRLEIQQSAFDN